MNEAGSCHLPASENRTPESEIDPMNNSTTSPAVINLDTLDLADSIRLVAVARWVGLRHVTMSGGRTAGWQADLRRGLTAIGPGNQLADLREGVTAPVAGLLKEWLDMLRADVGDRRPAWAVNADAEFARDSARRAKIKADVLAWVNSLIAQPAA